MSTVKNALIIGAGIAGPAIALALQKAGIECTIYESHSRSADEVGVMLTVATNGIDALRTLGADRQALAAGFPTPGVSLRSYTGKWLGVNVTGSTRAASEFSRTIKRADLYRALHDLALERGITIERGRRLASAEQNADGIRAVFHDGTEEQGDVLIGCDGIHSTVRRIIDPHAPAPRYTGLITTGGYATGIDTDIDPGNYEMIFGRRAFFGYAPAPSGDVWWFVNLPRRPEPARGEVEAISTAEWRVRMHDLYTGDAGPALRIINATEDFPPMTPIHTVPHLRTWHRGRIIIMGDAAHAPSPTSGQGASLSIEDGVVLAKCLRDLPSVEAAFTAFESIRRPRVERIVKAAARINNSKAAGPLARVLRDAMLPAILRMAANSKSNAETFGHHIDWDARIDPATVLPGTSR